MRGYRCCVAQVLEKTKSAHQQVQTALHPISYLCTCYIFMIAEPVQSRGEDFSSSNGDDEDPAMEGDEKPVEEI